MLKKNTLVGYVISIIAIGITTPSQADLISSFNLEGDLGQTRSAFTETPGLLSNSCPCTIIDTVLNLSTHAQKFNWIGPPFGATVAARDSTVTHFDTTIGVIEANPPGQVTFDPAGVTAPAPYYTPGTIAAQPPPNLTQLIQILQLLVLRNSLQKSPTHIEFQSSVQLIGNPSSLQYLYTDTAQNFDGSFVPFDWEGTGLQGLLAPAGIVSGSLTDTLSLSFVSNQPPQEIISHAKFTLGGESESVIPADFFVPVPEPNTFLLVLGAAVIMLLSVRRKRTRLTIYQFRAQFHQRRC